MNARTVGVGEFEEMRGPSVVLPFTHPDNARMSVVEDAGRVVASIGTYRVTWWEGITVAEDYRKRMGVVRSLLREAGQDAYQRGELWVLTTAADEEMKGYLERLGAPLKVDLYALPVEKFTCPHR